MSMIDNLIGMIGSGAVLVLGAPLYRDKWIRKASNNLGWLVIAFFSGALIGSVWMGAQ